MLSYGMGSRTNPDAGVRRLQQQLKTIYPDIVVDGIFRGETKKYVIKYQKSKGLAPDGVVGPLTNGALSADRASAVDPAAADPTVPDPAVVDETGTDETGTDEVETGAGSTQTGDATVIDTDALKSAFMAGMLEVGITGVDADALWVAASDLITDPDYDVTQIGYDMYDRENYPVLAGVFYDRFPAIETLREQREGGDTELFIPDPAFYLDYEKKIADQLDYFGSTADSMDFTTLVTSMLTNGVGETEATSRISAAKRVLSENTPQEVKDVFEKWYGTEGEGNLLKTFLDPSDEWGGTWQDVENQANVAFIAGKGDQLGDMDLTKQRAEQIYALGKQESALWTSFATLKDQEELFSEKLGEQDFTAEEEGVEGALFGGTEVEKRRQSRVAEFSGGGGAFISGEGTGLGSA